MLDQKIYNNSIKVTWCPGCGDYGILNAVKSALAQLEIHPHEVMFFSGIGCGSKLPDYLNANAFTTIHGRSLPIAMGAKLANHDLHVICVTGDGDGYGIGGNHFMNILRRNPDTTVGIDVAYFSAEVESRQSGTSSPSPTARAHFCRVSFKFRPTAADKSKYLPQSWADAALSPSAQPVFTRGMCGSVQEFL